MRRMGLRGSAALAWMALAPDGASAQIGAPLDVLDPTPRNVLGQIEGASNLGVVGQSFGPPVPATYSASGNTGTLTISIATHEQLRSGGGFVPVPSTSAR